MYQRLQETDLLAGDILVTVCDPANLLHLAISIAVGSPFVHVGLYIGDGVEYSTSPEGMAKRIIGDRYLVVLRPMTDNNLLGQAVVKIAETYMGTPYNVLGVALAGVEKLTGARVALPDRIKHRSRFCSEGVSDFYVLAGFDVLPRLENGQTLPEHFLNSDQLCVLGFMVNDRKDRGAKVA